MTWLWGRRGCARWFVHTASHAHARATQKVAVYENEVRGAVSHALALALALEIETPYPIIGAGLLSTPPNSRGRHRA